MVVAYGFRRVPAGSRLATSISLLNDGATEISPLQLDESNPSAVQFLLSALLLREARGRASSSGESANSRPFIPKGVYPRRSIQVAGGSWAGHGGCNCRIVDGLRSAPAGERSMYAAVPGRNRTGVPHRSNGICRVGVGGGARTASPRHTRIASTPLGWAIAEMTAALPPHFLHRRTPSRKTRFINSAQESLLSRRLAGSPWATSIVGTVACCEQ